MKKNLQFSKRALTLNKETVAKLNDEQMRNLIGGKYGVKKPEDEGRDNMSCWYHSCTGKTVVVQ